MTVIVRIVLVAILAAGAALGVYWVRSSGELKRTLAEMEALRAEMEQRIAEKEAMLERLSRSRRLAHVQVLAQTPAPEGGVAETELLFIEIDDAGREIARQRFVLPGDVLFVDAWAVKFHRDDVAVGHPLRGRTLLLLRRLYSDRMAPRDGYPIDAPGAVPPAYAAGDVAEFERRLWEQFWKIATDPALADALGVRVAQGEAVYKPVRAGHVYELTVDAAGGMSLVPLPDEDAAAPQG